MANNIQPFGWNNGYTLYWNGSQFYAADSNGHVIFGSNNGQGIYQIPQIGAEFNLNLWNNPMLKTGAISQIPDPSTQTIPPGGQQSTTPDYTPPSASNGISYGGYDDTYSYVYTGGGQYVTVYDKNGNWICSGVKDQYLGNNMYTMNDSSDYWTEGEDYPVPVPYSNNPDSLQQLLVDNPATYESLFSTQANGGDNNIFDIKILPDNQTALILDDNGNVVTRITVDPNTGKFKLPGGGQIQDDQVDVGPTDSGTGSAAQTGGFFGAINKWISGLWGGPSIPSSQSGLMSQFFKSAANNPTAVFGLLTGGALTGLGTLYGMFHNSKATPSASDIVKAVGGEAVLGYSLGSIFAGMPYFKGGHPIIAGFMAALAILALVMLAGEIFKKATNQGGGGGHSDPPAWYKRPQYASTGSIFMFVGATALLGGLLTIGPGASVVQSAHINGSAQMLTELNNELSSATGGKYPNLGATAPVGDVFVYAVSSSTGPHPGVDDQALYVTRNLQNGGYDVNVVSLDYNGIAVGPSATQHIPFFTPAGSALVPTPGAIASVDTQGAMLNIANGNFSSTDKAAAVQMAAAQGHTVAYIPYSGQ